MKIDIKRGETTRGMIRKTTFHTVTVIAEMTDEEKAIIKQNKLERVVVLERGLSATSENDDFSRKHIQEHPDAYMLKVKDMMHKDGDTHNFHSIGEANQYVAQLKEVLPKVKAMLDGNTEAGEDESIEF